MGDELKPGGLGSPSVVGTPSEFANSMAAAMETALNQLLADEGKPQVPTDNSPETRDRRIMFVAIAQGVVEHLVENQDAFKVRDAVGNPTTFKIEIID